MSGTKHLKTRIPSDVDSRVNPGIGQSKGSYAGKADPDEIKGDNTFEGDVGNDVNPTGGLDERRLGRRNR